MQRIASGVEKDARKSCSRRIGNVICVGGVATRRGGILSTIYCPSRTGALGQKITFKFYANFVIKAKREEKTKNAVILRRISNFTIKKETGRCWEQHPS